jgi:predicted DNA-binding transcriptional regulator AlpA
VPKNIIEKGLIEQLKLALREDLSQSNLTTLGLGHNRGPFDDPAVYTVPLFCLTHQLSRSTLYNLWRDGLGPKFFRIGSSVRISREAAQTWRREREAATVSAVRR